jgi:Predicted membrane protein
VTDLLLAIAHHLLVFTLAAILAAELAIIRPGLSGASLRRLGVVDLHYGLIATLILIVGFARVYMGVKGPEAYLGNWAFWAKIGAFVLVGLLSAMPTVRILQWRKLARADSGFALPEAEVKAVRPFLIAEAVVFAFIPVFAAMMARGYGL